MKGKGLSESEVLRNRELFGVNALPEDPPKSALDFALDTVKGDDGLLNRLLWIILGAMLLKFIFLHDGFDWIGLALVLTVLTVLAVKSGLETQKEERELAERTGRRTVNVWRGGSIVTIDTKEIVVGDYVILEEGSFVEADGFITDGKITVDNSILNGESKPAKKTPIDGFVFDSGAEIGGRDYLSQNLVFSGTSILTGGGTMVVTRVGTQTEQGKILMTVQDVDQTKTAMGIQINDIVNWVTKIGTIGAIAVAIVLSVQKLLGVDFSSVTWSTTTAIAVLFVALNIFGNAVSILVAAVPEGLPAIVGIVSNQMSGEMISNNVLPRHSERIPDAGSTQILATDKTKTLTVGKMTPIDIVYCNGEPMRGADLQMLRLNAIINNKATFNVDGVITGGNPTDQALLSLCGQKEYRNIIASTSVTDIKPFNSAWKYSSAVINGVSCYKGAPEYMFKKAKAVMINGEELPFDKSAVEEVMGRFADRAMRVIAFGHSSSPLTDELPDDLVLDGFVSMRDELRDEVPDAVAKCRRAGIQVMMVTGDSPRTAVAIAKDAGIYVEGENIALDAEVFDAMPDDEARNILRRLTVIGRSTPKTKLRIIQLAQSMGLCVSMTGDGTNDAPALKAADVGFGMGCGTAVCQSASDVIITDDNFASVVDGILYGRTFMHNIGKFLRFQLPINFGLIVLSVIWPVAFATEAFSTTMILILNIVMDTLNAVAFGGEPVKEEYMDVAPVPKSHKLLSGELAQNVIVSTITLVLLFFAMQLPVFARFFNDEGSRAAARFVLITFASMIGGFNIRTESTNLFKDIGKSGTFIKVFVGVMVGTVLLTQLLGGFIGCSGMSLIQWLIVLALSILVIPVDLARKKLLEVKNSGIL